MNKYYHKTLLAAGYGKDSEEYKKINQFLKKENRKFRLGKKAKEKYGIVFNYLSSFTDDEGNEIESFGSDEDVEEKIFHDLEMEAFHKCLMELSEEDRDFLLAIYKDGGSLRQVSRDLGIAHTTLLYRRDKLFKLLRQKMLGEDS